MNWFFEDLYSRIPTVRFEIIEFNRSYFHTANYYLIFFFKKGIIIDPQPTTWSTKSNQGYGKVGVCGSEGLRLGLWEERKLLIM